MNDDDKEILWQLIEDYVEVSSKIEAFMREME